jgi:polyferredoxin
MEGQLNLAESFKIYEEGKHRRYGLLFGVNGGAFAVAKLFTDPAAVTLLGDLTLGQLALGMILFTIVMTFDIFRFGQNMRETYLPDAFGTPGKVVLLLIGFLICAGWYLVI